MIYRPTRHRRLAITLLVIWFLALAAAPALAEDLTSSDGDGVPDKWKKSGVDVTFSDGQTVHINLTGARPGRKAVIVWVDWMAAADHTHRPVPTSDKQPTPFGAPADAHAIENSPLERVVRAFDFAPVDNNKGVSLVLIWPDKIPGRLFQPIPEKTSLGSTSLGADRMLHYDWTEFDRIRAARFPKSPALFGHGFHYAAFIHQMAGLSNTGLSKTIPGDEFLVSLGVLPNADADDQCGTFMHELGHNLGLNHGGADDTGYKPNYLSVMNYMFQRVGVANFGIFGHFDYSRFALYDINENQLSNINGISSDGALVTWGTAHVCTITPPDCGSGDYNIDSYSLVWRLNCPVDWQCAHPTGGTDSCALTDGVQPMTFQQDVNGDGCLGILKGYDDWSNLKYWSPILPGGGEVIRKPGLPTQELDATTPTLETSLTVGKVNAVQTPQGVDVRWSRIPLQRVIGYEVLRKGPSGIPSIVQRTKESEFIDRGAVPGVRYVYSVRPVFAVSLKSEVHKLQQRVSDALLPAATMLEQRAKRMNLLPPGSQLLRGGSTSARQVVAGQTAPR